jgi:hypothetical protein
MKPALRLSALLAALALTACVYDPYYPYGYPAYGGGTPATFDRAWSAALGAMYDQDVMITRQDRAAGIIDGRRGGINVNSRLVAQADGRVRVEINAGGAMSEDPGLPERISRSYDARMGR